MVQPNAPSCASIVAPRRPLPMNALSPHPVGSRSQTRSWRARKVGQSTRVAGAVCSAISVSKYAGSTASDRVVRGQVLPAPRLPSRPLGRRGGPELVRRGQPQREQSGGTEVETARRDVTPADMRLVPAESDREPTAGRVLVRPAGRVDGSEGVE